MVTLYIKVHLFSINQLLMSQYLANFHANKQLINGQYKVLPYIKCYHKHHIIMKAAKGTVLVVLGKMLLIVNSPLPPAHSVEVADISRSSKEELV